MITKIVYKTVTACVITNQMWIGAGIHQTFIKAQPGHAKKVTINNKPIHETMMKKQTLTIPDKAIIIPLTHILLKQLMVPCSVANI